MRTALKRWCFAALFLAPMVALAQTTNLITTNSSATITSGGVFQTVLAALFGAPGASAPRRSLTIWNNNASDKCWVFVGSGTATLSNSILLLAGASYPRYYPYIPSDAIQATCDTTNDVLYIDTQ